MYVREGINKKVPRTMIDDHAIEPSVTAVTSQRVALVGGPMNLTFLSNDEDPNRATLRI